MSSLAAWCLSKERSFSVEGLACFVAACQVNDVGVPRTRTTTIPPRVLCGVLLSLVSELVHI